MSLAPSIGTTDGTLRGSLTYYYAVTSNNSAGHEGALSFTVAAAIPDGTSTNSVSINNLSFPNAAASFNVYRGTSPESLYRIAQEVQISDSFSDNGLPPLPIGPPDPSFEHANLYYRYEYAGPIQVSSADQMSVTSADFGATPSAYTGMVVRIAEGLGRGQERSISGNTSTTINLLIPWNTVPDPSSSFVICEPSWHFGAVSATSPVEFEVPYRQGSVLQISGRGANVFNQEGSPDLCPITRLALGQQKPDFGVPAQPTFFLDALGGGTLTLSQIGFSDLSNIASVSSGTLRLYYWNELNTPSTAFVGSFNPTDNLVTPASTLTCVPGDIIQIGTELMFVNSIDNSTKALSVVRGVLGSAVEQHSAGDAILQLSSLIVTESFATGFFENRASVNFIHPFTVPDIRVSAAEFFVTNSFGDSQAQSQCYASTPEGGLRTLSGGQLSLQVSGYIATQLNATPATLIEKSHAVRDLRANLAQPAIGYQTVIDVIQNGKQYCHLVIEAGQTISNPSSSSSEVFDGVGLPPVVEGSNLTTNVTSILASNAPANAFPGRDLTVTLRF